jgi:hypothetical protein
MGEQPTARPLPIQENRNIEYGHSGFKPTIPVFERVKTFPALDPADTPMGTLIPILLSSIGLGMSRGYCRF